jgi:hypothetical protein
VAKTDTILAHCIARAVMAEAGGEDFFSRGEKYCHNGGMAFGSQLDGS